MLVQSPSNSCFESGVHPLKIRGTKAANGHYYLPALVACGNPEFVRPTLFLVDLGATRTTLVAERLGLSCNGLGNGDPTLSSMGQHTPYCISNVLVVFETSHGKQHVELLEKVDVIKLENCPFDGLLGIDIVNRFRLRTDKNGLTFES